MEQLDATATYEALHEGVVGIAAAADVVRVGGPDALSFLQGQVSQDLGPLAPGESVETLVLSAQGKLDGWGRIARTDDTTACVVVDGGFGEAMLARLKRYKVRVRAELELAHWRVVMLRGPGARPAAAETDAEIVLPVDYPGFAGCDLVGAAVACPTGVPLGDPVAFEAARIEAGVPVMGRELTDKTIPQEAGLVGRAVSLTKGCFTGQELVARLDARGSRVARRLVGFTIASGAPAPGDAVTAGTETAGVLTSVAWSPRTASPVALGYLRRGIAVPSRVEVVHGTAALAAEAAELPLWHEPGVVRAS